MDDEGLGLLQKTHEHRLVHRPVAAQPFRLCLWKTESNVVKCALLKFRKFEYHCILNFVANINSAFFEE